MLLFGYFINSLILVVLLSSSYISQIRTLTLCLEERSVFQLEEENIRVYIQFSLEVSPSHFSA